MTEDIYTEDWQGNTRYLFTGQKYCFMSRNCLAGGYSIHMNRVNFVLQMQIDIFCEDICKAAEKWLNDVSQEATIQESMKSLDIILYPDKDGVIRF